MHNLGSLEKRACGNMYATLLCYTIIYTET